MSLAPSERLVLARIEASLRRSDPHLDAQLTVFTLAGYRGPLDCRRWLATARRAARGAFPLALVLASVVLVVAGLVVDHMGPAPAARSACAIAFVHSGCRAAPAAPRR